MDVILNGTPSAQAASLTEAEADRRGGYGLPVTEALSAVEHFRRRLSLLRYDGQGDPDARRARDALDLLWPADGVDGFVPRLLDEALELTGADFGNVQLADPGTGALRIAAQAGFEREFLDYFAVVDDDASACGHAARLRSQTVVADTVTDPDFSPHREIAEASGFRAVQSTPLLDRGGALVGVVSTHYRTPGRPPDADLRSLQIFGRLAGEALRQIAVSRAAVEGPGAAGGFDALLPFLSRLESEDNALARLAEIATHRIYAASLGLAAAQTDLNDHVLRARLATAVTELDNAIREIQSAVIEMLYD